VPGNVKEEFFACFYCLRYDMFVWIWVRVGWLCGLVIHGPERYVVIGYLLMELWRRGIAVSMDDVADCNSLALIDRSEGCVGFLVVNFLQVSYINSSKVNMCQLSL
jgi:hypothetical protein